MTYLKIWLLRCRMWRIFGLPFGATVAPWRVILRRKQVAGKPWYFYTRIDGKSIAQAPAQAHADCEIGPVFGGSKLPAVLEHARQQWDRTRLDIQRYHLGEYKPSAPPAAPPPPATPDELTLAGHEKQWNPELNGMVCECGWQSPRSSHTLHLAHGSCAECREIWQAWRSHLNSSTGNSYSQESQRGVH